MKEQLSGLFKILKIDDFDHSSGDINRLSLQIVDSLRQTLKADVVALYFKDSFYNCFTLKETSTLLETNFKKNIKIDFEKGIIGWVAHNEKSLLIKDIEDQKFFDVEHDEMIGVKIKSILCAPLIFNDEILGIIQVINVPESEPFTDEEFYLFKECINEISSALYHVHFFKSAHDQKRIDHQKSVQAHIQKILLPEFYENNDDFIFAAQSKLAGDFCSGFYEYKKFENGSFAFTLGDLHQKGFAGSMYASLMSGALSSFSENVLQKPSAVCHKINYLAKEKISALKHSSFFYAVASEDCKSITFVAAGIVYPILVRDGKAHYLKFNSSFLGVENFKTKSVTLKMRPDDLFLVLTDGTINVRNSNDKRLGLKQIMDFLPYIDYNSQRVVNSLIDFSECAAEGNDITDDLTVVALRIWG